MYKMTTLLGLALTTAAPAIAHVGEDSHAVVRSEPIAGAPFACPVHFYRLKIFMPLPESNHEGTFIGDRTVNRTYRQ